jgi:hypothetical protein
MISATSKDKTWRSSAGRRVNTIGCRRRRPSRDGGLRVCPWTCPRPPGVAPGVLNPSGAAFLYCAVAADAGPRGEKRPADVIGALSPLRRRACSYWRWWPC